jgi:hypothetical protein
MHTVRGQTNLKFHPREKLQAPIPIRIPEGDLCKSRSAEHQLGANGVLFEEML